ncbi:MAG: PilN domain-containing protein [Desulfobacterales bacterium]
MALREINLVPPEVVARRFVFRHLNLWAGCLAGALLLVAGFFVHQSRVVSAGSVSQDSFRATTAKLNAKIDEIGRLKKEVEGIARDQSAMDEISGKQSYSRILLKLSAVLNAGTWLSQIAVDAGSEEDSPLRMKLTGYAISNKVLGDFMNRLSADPTFGEVVLKFSREGQTGDPNREGDATIEVVLFHVECSISDG